MAGGKSKFAVPEVDGDLDGDRVSISIQKVVLDDAVALPTGGRQRRCLRRHPAEPGAGQVREAGVRRGGKLGAVLGPAEQAVVEPVGERLEVTDQVPAAPLAKTNLPQCTW